jgi:hypothetical protein
MPDPTSPPAASELTWAHTDSRGIGPGIAASFLRATTRGWRNDEASTADLRALVLNSFLQVAMMGFAPPSSSQNVLSIHPYPSARQDYRDAQDALMLAVYALLAENPAAKYSITENIRFETEDGTAPAPPTSPETGFLWEATVVVAIIVVTGAVAAVVSDWLDQKNQIEATKLATDANAQKLAATLAAANQLVEAHLDREQTTGQTIPWEPAELDLLSTLKSDTKSLAEWKAPELKQAPIAAGAANVLGSTGKAVESVGKGASAGIGVGAVLAVLGGIYLLLLNERESRKVRAAA